jgi:MoxR-like ATPase
MYDPHMTSPAVLPVDADQAELAFERLSRLFADARAEIERAIIGQPQVVELALVALLAGGHALVVGLPGLAKTRLVKTLGHALGLDTRRIQFTPDLMPSDILGAEILESATDGSRSFRFIPGPVFGQLVMADEINRASPRTQSALLEAMQEKQVTVAGITRRLPEPFHVIATQNPIEQDGTYPLPEAQLDRFLLQITVDYPSLDAEREILLTTTGPADAQVARLLEPADLMSAQALLTAARARAFLGGRTTPILDDVAALLGPALRHRLELSYAARASGRTPDELVARLADELG